MVGSRPRAITTTGGVLSRAPEQRCRPRLGGAGERTPAAGEPPLLLHSRPRGAPRNRSRTLDMPQTCVNHAPTVTMPGSSLLPAHPAHTAIIPGRPKARLRRWRAHGSWSGVVRRPRSQRPPCGSSIRRKAGDTSIGISASAFARSSLLHALDMKTPLQRAAGLTSGS
jgi:hypothetical protein